MTQPNENCPGNGEMEADWWTEANKIADRIAVLIEESGAGDSLPAVACLLALKKELDGMAAEDGMEALPCLKGLRKSVAACIHEFAALAGTPKE